MAWLILTQILVVTGALAVYLLLPKGEKNPQASLGVVVGLLTTGGLLSLLPAWFGSIGTTREVYFLIFAAIAILATVRVITHHRPVYSALYFVLTVLASAGLLLLVNAQFLGIAVVIIYAGAILVTYVFVIMLAMQGGAPEYDHVSREPLAASVAGLMVGGLVLGLVGMDAKAARYTTAEMMTVPAAAAPALVPGQMETVTGKMPGPPTGPMEIVTGKMPVPPVAPLSNLESVGLALIGEYAVSLEVAGLLLLVAMVGGLAIARRRAESDVEEVG